MTYNIKNFDQKLEKGANIQNPIQSPCVSIQSPCVYILYILLFIYFIKSKLSNTCRVFEHQRNLLHSPIIFTLSKMNNYKIIIILTNLQYDNNIKAKVST